MLILFDPCQKTSEHAVCEYAEPLAPSPSVAIIDTAHLLTPCIEISFRLGVLYPLGPWSNHHASCTLQLHTS